MSVSLREVRSGQRAPKGASSKKPHQYYLYHNNSKSFHEVRSGMRIGRIRAGDDQPAIHVEDSLVSKAHCRLWVQGNVIFLEDLGAVNSTRVNSVPMQSRARRKVLLHDVVEVGNQRFILTQQNRRPPAFTEDLSRRTLAPYRARRKGDGSLTAVLAGQQFHETLIAVNSSQYRELRIRSAVREAGSRVRRGVRSKRWMIGVPIWVGIGILIAVNWDVLGDLAQSVEPMFR